MKNIMPLPFIILCMIMALGSCIKESYAADVSDLNGTWQPDWSYKATLAMPEEERDDSFTQREYS